MIDINILFSLVNTILLLVFGIIYFRNNYCIITKELYEGMVEVVEEYNNIIAQQEEEQQQPQELPGGCGFFREYIEEDYEEEDE